MRLESEIWTAVPNDEDGLYREGEVTVDVADADMIILRFYVDGEQVAHAQLDRFDAGMLVGKLAQAAVEALPA